MLGNIDVILALDKGQTALDIAAGSKNMDAVSALIENGDTERNKAYTH